MESSRIDNSLGGNDGYGYQIWCEREHGFSFRSIGSQSAIALPDKDFLFASIAASTSKAHRRAAPFPT